VASVDPDGSGGLLLNRTPSRRSAYETVRVTFPAPLRMRDKRSIPWLSALLPIVFAGGVCLYTGEMMFLLFALLGPLTLGATAYSNRRADKQAAKRDQARLAAENEALSVRLSQATDDETAWRRQSAPSGIEAAEIALGRQSRLWERSPGDVDFLQVRLGQGPQRASIQLDRAPEGTQPPQLADVPLCVGLPSAGVLGIAGARHDRSGLARSLLIQLAALHAADEVRIALLAEHAAEDEWGLLRWIPHTWAAEGRQLDVAQGGEEISALVVGLLKIVEERRNDRWTPDDHRGPYHVVVLEGGGALRKRPLVAELLQTGPTAGVYAIVLDDELRLLPEECRTLARIEGGQVTAQTVADRQTRTGSADTIELDLAHRAARALAPIRRVGGADSAQSSLPGRVTLFEVLGGRPTIDGVTRGWATGQPRTNVPVGADGSGPVTIDLVGSGPHALVAGTSGMGKSELIQTWVTSLAVHNRPDQLAFLFVEYKGLSAFLRLQHLPHCVGTITNLSAELTSRALASLDAEKRRRQNLFVVAGVADFPAYQRTRAQQPALEPMPRLVIVLDEFAELKQNLPEFIDGLISIARTGRSLGIHLILATQQVSRAVSAEISSNATLRVSLRAQTPEDSFAVLDSKVANTLPLGIKGRAYVRRGELSPELFQTAWGGAPADSGERATLIAHPWPWRSDELRYQTTLGSAGNLVSEMDEAIELMTEATERLGIVRPRRPFTEPLEHEVRLDELLEQAPIQDLNDLVRLGGPVIGVSDDLARQVHEPYAVPLLRGHVAVFGSSQSGRTTALRSTIASWAQVMPPSMFQVHAIDSGRGLAAVAALPHAGTVTSTDGVKMSRLLSLLAAEVNRRLAWLEEHSMGDLVEMWGQREAADPVPWLLLVIDRFEDLLAAVERTPAEATLERILSHGTAAGVTVMAAGDETLARARWQQRFASRLVLRNTGGLDPTVAGLPSRTPLAGLVNGRCYETAKLRLVQLAYDGASPAAADQNAALRRHGQELEVQWATLLGTPPLRLRDLPDEVSASSLPTASSHDCVVIGLGGDAAAPVELSRRNLPMLVVGAEDSGRTDVLTRLAKGWLKAGLEVTVACTSASRLLSRVPAGARVITADGELDWLRVLADPSAAVIVDDLHTQDLPDDLVAALEKATPQCFFAGSSSGMAIVPAPLRAIVRAGSLLYLAPTDARVVDYFGVRVDPALCATEPRGRGVLITGRQQLAVQVVTADE
jgi:S-DNA-T family DNA segregation ATPase FtsK/SpoIIIE